MYESLPWKLQTKHISVCVFSLSSLPYVVCSPVQEQHRDDTLRNYLITWTSPSQTFSRQEPLDHGALLIIFCPRFPLLIRILLLDGYYRKCMKPMTISHPNPNPNHTMHSVNMLLMDVTVVKINHFFFFCFCFYPLLAAFFGGFSV